jgi:hypothetical protein
MENKVGKRNAEHNCGLYCPCGKMSVGHLIVKIFIAVSLIGLGLAIAMTVCYGLSKHRISKSHYGFSCGAETFQSRSIGAKAGSGTIMVSGSNVAYKAGGEMMDIPERIFGVITKIEANKITIKNNAAQEQLVVSQADTVIVSATTEVGLASLQVGQNIIVIGSYDKDKVLNARMISIK